jgi:hypothetical protein
MGAFANRLGTRFLVVTVVPNVLLIGYISFLVAAGAPAHSPSLMRALTILDDLTANRIVAVVLAVLIISVAIHPLQIPLIQLLEGYWWGMPWGARLADHATQRFRGELARVNEELDKAADLSEQDWATKNSARQAQFRKDWLPEYEEDLRPTALGNTLWTGETTAGKRYGLDLNLALPRIIPLMSSSILAELSDRRNQLDAAVRLCVVAGVAVAVSIGLLAWHGPWLFLALGPYMLSWASYRAAVAAARGFSITLATAIDLYHLELFDALSLERPANITEEISRNITLTKLFRGDYLTPVDKGVLVYISSKPDNEDDKKEPATAPPEPDRGFAEP